MADPFSIATGVAGLVSLGVQVTGALLEYYQDYKHQDSDIAAMTCHIESVHEYFQLLSQVIAERKSQGDESLTRSIESSVTRCDNLLQQLLKKYSKFERPSGDLCTRLKVTYSRALYPFKKSTLEKLKETADEIRDNISPVLQMLQLKDNKRIHDRTTEIKTLVELVRASQIASDIRTWLNAPDATSNHYAACAKSHTGSGSWLLQSTIFESWLDSPNSFLWLNGFAGCGKSVLLSTVIQHTFHDRQCHHNTGTAFFYFAFSDESKQNTSAMLKALLLQLSSQHSAGKDILKRLHDKYELGTPPLDALEDALRELLSLFTNVFVFVDALDESPWPKARGEVLATLNHFRDWKVPGMHLLATSRDLSDIRDDIQPLPEEDVAMVKNKGVDQDIASYIAGRLDTDRRLAKWKPFRSKIEDGLTLRAQGVFRWVDCQFTLLQSCPRTESHLGKLLESLPADLDETYERMLLEVQRRGLTFDLRRVLLLLFYAHTPMVISEVIDGLAVDIDDRPGLNLRRRLQDEDDVLQICSGFVEVDLEDRPSRFHYDEPDRNIIKVRVLRIAHFTVQEYLESDRLPPQLRDNFGLNATLGHQEMVRIFVAYLSDPELSAEAHTESSRERVIAAYPLAEYAAKHWYLHYRQASRHYKDLDNLVLEIFMDSQIYATWSELTKDVPVEEVWQSGKPLPLLYIPALFGLDSICLRLLQMKAPNEYQELVNENVQGFGTVLHAACESGETRTAELLLEHGADANIQGDSYRTALVTATSSGSLELVGMLLKHGADVDTPPNTNIARTALQEAAYRDSVEIVELLLEHGAGVNIQGGDYGTALQAAVSGCSILVAETLLKHGADVNARLDDAFWCGTALQEAVSRGFVETVEMLEMLLEHDADVNIQTGGLFGTALQAAAHSGSVEVVEMLLDHGAEINANTGYYGTALCAASGSGHMDVMRLLIAKKADVNITGGLFEDSALHHAAEHCEVDAVRLLLENGAYIDTRNNSGCTPLLGAASAAQNDASDTASLLLEYGANPNACDEDGGSALYRACVAGGMGVVTVLLADDRTDINAGSTLGTPLEAASALMTNSRYSGDDKIARKIARKNAIVKLLLERGATPTAPEEQERSLPDRSSDTS